VVVETAAKTTVALRERFYELEDPEKAITSYPYTGGYQFVPLLKSKEWSIQKIYHLAQLHVAMVDDLKPIYLQNLLDINHIVPADEVQHMQKFYDLHTTSTEHPKIGHVPGNQLLHSIHNTNKQHTKVALVQSAKYMDALDQLENLDNILHNLIASIVAFFYQASNPLSPVKEWTPNPPAIIHLMLPISSAHLILRMTHQMKFVLTQSAFIRHV
jgi:hypothetical protein